jgi:hypothetical protein
VDFMNGMMKYVNAFLKPFANVFISFSCLWYNKEGMFGCRQL